MDCAIYVEKTKVLISCVVTAQLICTFVFAYAFRMFSHDTGHLSVDFVQTQTNLLSYTRKSLEV